MALVSRINVWRNHLNPIDAPKIKWFNQEKGFGFIEPGDGSAAIVVDRKNLHFSEVGEGEEVEYDVQQRVRGDRAVNVHRLIWPWPLFTMIT